MANRNSSDTLLGQLIGKSDALAEIKEKIRLFKNRKNHQRLKVHKLHGRYQGFFGFSIDRKYRVMFEWISDEEARLHTVGDHSIYD